MLTKKYLSKVVELTNPVDGIYSVSFQSQGKRYKFQPGQFLHLSVDSEYDGIGQWPESRCFSMQSSPGEQIVKITYAVNGAYTRLMEKKLSAGREVWLKMPYGDLFQRDHDKNNTVFIAGGTGITPYLSLFTHQSFATYKKPKIYLGFRSKKFNIYQQELAQLKNDLATVKLWCQDIGGVLDINTIYSENGIDSDYFISGPPAMISNFKNYLIGAGVPTARVLTDDWE